MKPEIQEHGEVLVKCVSSFNWRCGLLLKISFLTFVLLLFPAPDSSAAEKLAVDLMPLGPRLRSDAPLPVEARFKWDSTRLLEGRLEMEFREGNRVLGHYRSGELALSGGEQSFRVLLPPILTPMSDSQVEVRLKFVGNKEVFNLDPSSLFVPTMRERSLVIAWCDAAALSGHSISELAQHLRFDQFAPAADATDQRALMSGMVRLTPGDLPAHPLSYTAFDVVVLTADAFQEAGERQLQALARWVRGGGSVFVSVPGKLQPRHLSFLNQLADSAAGPAFLSDSAGNVLPPINQILCLHSGVGRSVIAADKQVLNSNFAASEWRQAAAFLWKFRGSQIQSIAQSGSWTLPADDSAQNRQPNSGRNFYNYRPANRTISSMLQMPDYESDLVPALMDRLMPKTVRLIPFSALLGLLAVFVLLIGPVDYFLLGRLRRRRLTWVLFPATSVAVTVVTVMMANHYLGLRDQRRALVVVDLARDGTALRWNRYELAFAARDKQTVTELKDTLWVPLGSRMAPSPIYGAYGGRPVPYYPNNNGYPYTTVARDVNLPVYEGILPVHYQTTGTMQQWRPELNRYFSFEPPTMPLPASLREIDSAWPDLSRIRQTLAGKSSFPGNLYVVSGRKVTGSSMGSAEILSPDLLVQLCVGPDWGLPILLSQISPTGGASLDDLKTLDPESRDSVLLIVTQAGEDIIVYRRFFYER